MLSFLVLCSLSGIEPPDPQIKREPNNIKEYIVEYGDSLGLISLRLYGSFNYTKRLGEWNNITNLSQLSVGQRLKLLKKPTLSTRKGNGLLVKFWLKYLTEKYPEENFKLIVKNNLEIMTLKAVMKINEKNWDGALDILDKNLRVLRMNPVAIKLWTNVLDKQKRYNESLKIYQMMIDYQYDGDIFNAKKGEINKKLLARILELGKKYLNVFKRDGTDYETKRIAFNKALKYFRVTKRHKYDIYTTYLSLAQLYAYKGWHYEAFAHLHHLMQFKEVKESKEYTRIVNFFLGVSTMRTGASELPVKYLDKVIKETDADQLSKSAENVIRNLEAGRLNGIFTIAREYGSNEESLPDSLKENKDVLKGARSNKLSLAIYGSSYELLRHQLGYGFIGFYNKQEKAEHDYLSTAYYSFNFNISRSFLFQGVPKLDFRYSKLMLNELEEDNKYHLNDFMSTYTMEFSWTRDFKTGQFYFSSPLSFLREDGQNINDSTEFGVSLRYNLWRVNDYLSPGLEFEILKENVYAFGQDDHLSWYLGIDNRMLLPYVNLNWKMTYEYLSKRPSKDDERSFTYSLKANIPLRKIYRTLSLNIEGKIKKTKEILTADKITKHTLNFKLSIFY